MSLATFKLSKENIINQFKADPLEVFSVEDISLDKDLKIQSKVFDSYEDLMIHSLKSIDFSYLSFFPIHHLLDNDQADKSNCLDSCHLKAN